MVLCLAPSFVVLCVVRFPTLLQEEQEEEESKVNEEGKFLSIGDAQKKEKAEQEESKTFAE